MNKQLWRSAIVASAFVLVLGVLPVAVYAEDGQSGDSTTTNQSGPESDSDSNSSSGSDDQQTSGGHDKLKTELQDLKKERSGEGEHRLAANKLKACAQRKTKIQATMNRSITRAERQLALFTTISERVKTFYADKGYKLDNYAALVAAVDTAKANAQANLDTLKSLDSFDCNAADPKGDVQGFKLALQSVNQNLKDYRTAVKNLIVGVKSANPGQESGGQQ
jgi:hypothetical protein